ncbi:MAG TPA: hypothetical protein VF666_01805 [Pyrinomonadaceae bacterium]|jgi:hypothetical protein
MVLSHNKWRLETRHFLMQKEGAAFSECEDAIGINPEALRYAVADGATEAFDSGTWARRLADSWVQDASATPSLERFRLWVAEQSHWLHDSWKGRTLPWYAEEKARSGSHAAFVGLQLHVFDDNLYWHAVALGDSCLIHLRGDTLCCAMPISDYQDFNSYPLLVPSDEAQQQTALSHAVFKSGAVEYGDVLLLLTDASAAWYLQLCEERSRLKTEFDSLLATSQNDALEVLVKDERRANKIKDDDFAVLRIAVEDA